jgi:hypothetical protein
MKVFKGQEIKILIFTHPDHHFALCLDDQFSQLFIHYFKFSLQSEDIRKS